VPDGGAEDASLFWTVLIGPDHDKIVGATAAISAINDLSSSGDWMCRIKDVNIVVMFFLDRGPIA